MGKRVLIAEDSSVVHDIIKLFLSKNGHTVTIKEDGSDALETLLREDFDVALIDYFLPGLNGVELVDRYAQAAVSRKMPRFIAMTGDPKSFLASEGSIERFETVLAKPLDIESLVALVEEDPAEQPARAPAPFVGHRRQGAPTRAYGADRYALYYPADFIDEMIRKTRVRIDLQGPPEVLVVTSSDDTTLLSSLNDELNFHMVPVVDLGGKLGGRATLSGRDRPPSEDRVADLISEFQARRDKVHPDFLAARDTRERVLTCGYVNGGTLPVTLNPAYRRLSEYPSLMDPETLENAMPSLIDEGLVLASFRHRLQVCPSCTGSRLAVYEICGDCSSADLREETYLHHYRCAYQDVRSAFEQGDDLICPKCARELRHFGKDYDLPGQAIVCNACQTTASDPEIEFRCLDCETRVAGKRILTRDVHDYTLTKRGHEAVEFGLLTQSAGRSMFRFSDLPLQLVARINRLVAQSGDEAQFCLGSISYPQLRYKEADHGVSAVLNTRTLMVRLALERVSPLQAATGQSADFLLFEGENPDAVRTQIIEALANSRDQLSIDLEPQVDVFVKSDIF